jgi:hypothetical protein
MTAEEFERQYAERSGLTVERLRALGRVVIPCRCGWNECEGWQSVSKQNAEDPFIRRQAGLDPLP